MNDTYTKMCFEATEIQEAWTKSIGDAVYYEPAQNHICYVTNGRLADDRTGKADLRISFWDEWIHEDKLTWLPRIEDLIKIYLTDSVGNHYYAIQQLAQYTKANVNGPNDRSALEWMLMFVMHERCRKMWSEATKTWVKLK